MKLISLWEPWATLMAIGAKRIETRSWSTNYRGWLAIQSSKCWNLECQRWVCEDEFVNAIEPHYGKGHADDGTWLNEMKNSLPRGHIVAVARLVNCCPVEDRGCLFGVFRDYPELDTGREREFGDFSEGRWAFVTEDLFRLPRPIPFRAGQRLCNVTPEALAEIQRQWTAGTALINSDLQLASNLSDSPISTGVQKQ